MNDDFEYMDSETVFSDTAVAVAEPETVVEAPVETPENSSETAEVIEPSSAEDKDVLAQDSLLNCDEIIRSTKNEVELIIQYMLNTGKSVPDSVRKKMNTSRLEELLIIHAELSTLILPANPQSIRYITNHTKNNKFRRRIPLVRNLMIGAIISMLLLFGTGVTSYVNQENLSKGILNSSGIPLLFNLLFLTSAAAIGSIFYLLPRISNELKNYTFDATDISSYLTRIIIGLLGGVILSELVGMSLKSDDSTLEVNRLLFSLLGGFSSELVYKILEMIIEKIKSFFG